MFNSGRPMKVEGSSQERWSGAERSERIGFEPTAFHEQSTGLLLDKGSTDICKQMRGGSNGFAMSDLTLFDAKAESARSTNARNDVVGDAFSHMDRAGAVAMSVRNMQRNTAA
jgi:hypothetical protein